MYSRELFQCIEAFYSFELDFVDFVGTLTSNATMIARLTLMSGFDRFNDTLTAFAQPLALFSDYFGALFPEKKLLTFFQPLFSSNFRPMLDVAISVSTVVAGSSRTYGLSDPFLSRRSLALRLGLLNFTYRFREKK